MSAGLRLATALMVMASLPACKPLEDVFTMLNGGEPDVTQKMQGTAYLSYTPDPEPDIVPEPEPIVTPPPKDCTKEAYRWRYQIMSECDTILGYYGLD